MTDFWNIHAFTGNSIVAVRPPLIEHADSTRFMLTDLARSGLLPADIDAYPTAPERGTAQYVIPYPQDGMYRIKRDDPRFKYKAPTNRNEVWWSSKQAFNTFRSAPTLLIVEGEKKAARAVLEWPEIPTIGIGGVWNGSTKQADGTYRLHDALVNAVAPGQKIVIVFDNDILERDDLQKAAYTLYALLERHGCRPELYVPPPGTKGFDDYLVHRKTIEKKHVALEEVGLVRVPFDHLAPTRQALIDELSLDVNSEGGIVISATNYARLFTRFVGPHVKYDVRLGFVSPKGFVDIGKIRLNFITYIESNMRLKYIHHFFNHALEMFTINVTTDVLMDEIRSVKWDGVARLDTWGNRHISNIRNFPQLSNEWGRLLMTGLGMRLLEPGTKFDHVMYLVGPQGIYKTTFFEKLATFKCGRFYGTIEKLSSDDGARRTLGTRVRRNIILDFSESSILDGRQTSIESLKSFITLTEDEYREAYSKILTQLPRSFIFVGTSNKHNQLYDTTGSRRWAMLDVKDAVQPLEYDEKMQILAEVFARAEEFKATDWWNFRLSWDDVPIDVVEEIEAYGFMPNVNLSEGSQVLEGLNLKHIKEDPNILEFKLLLENPDTNFASVTTMTDTYATTLNRLMDELSITKSEATRLVRHLQDDPHFPWELAYGQIMHISNFSFPKDYNPYTFGGVNMTKQVRAILITRK